MAGQMLGQQTQYKLAQVQEEYAENLAILQKERFEKEKQIRYEIEQQQKMLDVERQKLEVERQKLERRIDFQRTVEASIIICEDDNAIENNNNNETENESESENEDEHGNENESDSVNVLEEEKQNEGEIIISFSPSAESDNDQTLRVPSGEKRMNASMDEEPIPAKLTKLLTDINNRLEVLEKNQLSSCCLTNKSDTLPNNTEHSIKSKSAFATLKVYIPQILDKLDTIHDDIRKGLK